MTVFASEREGEPRGIREARWCSVNDLRDQGQGLQRARAEFLG
jgi:hypothetical protein